MERRWVSRVVLICLAAMCFLGMAQDEAGIKAGVGIKAGTPGVGVEFAMPFTPNIGGRIGVNYFTYSYDTTQDGVDYDIDLTLFNIAGLIDWHPTGGSFRLTGGLLYNGNELEGEAEIESGETVKIGDGEYTAAEVGTLKAKLDFPDIAPYIGIGWDTSFGSEKQWGFVCDIGVIYHNSPSIELKSKGGTLSNDTNFLAELEEEEDDIEDNIEDFKLYPVITVGLIFRF